MARVTLYLPGDAACAIWNRTTAIARGLQGPDEPRTLTQLRPDIAAARLLSTGNTLTGTGNTTTDGGGPADPTQGAASGDALRGAMVLSAPHDATGQGSDNASGSAATSTAVTKIGEVPTPRADVLVMVPVLSLLGATEEPAVLDGLGPIPASMARKLVADGAESFYRVLVDPRDGAPLEIGRKNYRLPETIKRWIRMRDGKCTFPGCTNHTPDNDTDHLKAWEHGGTTGTSNLGQLCPKHHRLKHHSQWTPNPATNNEPPGWTSPTGRHYKPEHPHPEPTHLPPGFLPTDAPARAIEVAAPQEATSPLDLAPPWIGPHLSEDPQWQEFLAEMPVWPDPPVEEPPGDNVLDSDQLCPADPLWDEFYAKPYVLPPDPQADWQLLLSQM